MNNSIKKFHRWKKQIHNSSPQEILHISELLQHITLNFLKSPYESHNGKDPDSFATLNFLTTLLQ